MWKTAAGAALGGYEESGLDILGVGLLLLDIQAEMLSSQWIHESKGERSFWEFLKP